MFDRPITAVVTEIRSLSSNVRELTLLATSGRFFPDFSPGAHLVFKLPNDDTRSYSIVSQTADSRFARIGVKKDPDGRGGSLYMHELNVGDLITVVDGRNDFELTQHGGKSVFLAGGIGITPILPMVRSLSMQGRPWELHYAVRTPEDAVFRDALKELPGGAVHMYYSDTDGKMIPVAEVLGGEAPGTYFYCCGPAPMIDIFLTASSLDEKYLRYERFSGVAAAPAEVAYEVRLARAGRTIMVEVGETILNALLRNGITVDHSCQEGLCGACETRVLEGEVEHRDLVLDDYERAEGKMMICCSIAKSASLTLDI
ncbi:MAG: oxidoreductase [Nitratireductor sp.]|nr:oxidoreductase [Nitratireductor sp.]